MPIVLCYCLTKGDENVEKRWIFILTVLAALIGSAIYALRRPLEFETSALVRIKTPPLPENFSLGLGWGPDFLRIPELAVQVAQKLSEDPEERWPIISWIYEHLEIRGSNGLLTLKLRGGFEPRVVYDALTNYLDQVKEKLKADLKGALDAESRRLSDLQTALEGHRQELVQALEGRLEQRRAALQAQRDVLQKEIQEELINKYARLRIGEQGATLESWYLRNQLEGFMRRLQSIEHDLDLLQTRGIHIFEDEYKQVSFIENRLESLARAQVEAKRLLESKPPWEPLETVTPPQLPQGAVGPDRLGIILWGTGGGVLAGLLLVIFLPRRREQKSQR